MLAVSPVELPEGKPRGGLDDGLGLAVQPELAVRAVARPQLLARHREHAPHAVAHEHGVHAGGYEHSDKSTGGGGGGQECIGYTMSGVGRFQRWRRSGYSEGFQAHIRRRSGVEARESGAFITIADTFWAKLLFSGRRPKETSFSYPPHLRSHT